MSESMQSENHDRRQCAGRCKRRAVTVAVTLAFLACSGPLRLAAQDYTDRVFISYPGAMKTWAFRAAAGVSVTVLPRQLVEEELRQVPMLGGEARFGLPLNLSLTARAATNVITNGAGIGALWSLRIRRFALAIGDEQAFWYGFATVDGFDLRAHGWLNFPSISAGFAFDEFILSLKAEAQLVTYQRTVAGEIGVQSKKNTISGVAFTVAVEQPFWADRHFKVGAKINYSRQLYHAWLAFGTFNEFLAYPEFFVMMIF